MEEQQQQEEQDITTLPTEEEEQPEATKSVKNFWERLDEVFTQNTELRERMEELVEQFPTEQRVNTSVYRSFLFQPERISLCSNDDTSLDTAQALVGVPTPPDASGNIDYYYPTSSQGHAEAERFSSFRIRLARPLRNVKSIQLLSAVIPNAIQNIPDDQVFFLYYKVRSIANSYKGAWSAGTKYNPGDIITYVTTEYVLNAESIGAPVPSLNPKYQSITLPPNLNRPNYYDLNPYRIQTVFFLPTFSWSPEYQAADPNLSSFFNRTFEDYNDLVNSLNIVASSAELNCSEQDDISFQYNEQSSKIIFTPNPANIAAGYYYLPLGYADPNISGFFSLKLFPLAVDGGVIITDLTLYDTLPASIMNPRLGFTWNGVFPNPFLSANPWTDKNLMASLYWYLRSNDPDYQPSQIALKSNFLTFNSYPDLVNTSCVRVYADFALGSTEDSLNSTSSTNNSSGGLLSIVPVNTTNLGVGFYQNNFDNPLTKVPQNITEVGINMLTDQGTPFYLPNSATVLLELGITYQ